MIRRAGPAGAVWEFGGTRCRPDRSTGVRILVMAGQTTEQGYGWPHQQERARWARYQKAGGDDEHGALLCRADSCLMPSRWIAAGEPWDLGHRPGQLGYRGPEHVGCNRSAGARASNRGGNPGRGARRKRRRVELVEVSVDPSDL